MSVSVIAYSHRYEKGGLAVVRLYVAGENAVSVIEDGRVETGLEGRGARCLALDPKDPDTLYVGTSDEGIFKSEDGGGTWEKLSGIEHPRITAVAVSPTDGAVYAGTEPSALFVSRDGGGSWRELEGMRNLPSAPTWSFPPRPWTSHVRAIALSHADPDLVVAGIELGGVVKSTDFGESWEAADGGMDLHYVWGLAADAEDPSLVYTSAASGPGRAHGAGSSNATIYRRSGDERWQPVLEGLFAFPYALCQDPETPGTLYAGFGDGTILRSADAGAQWEEVAQVASGLQALTAVSA